MSEHDLLLRIQYLENGQDALADLAGHLTVAPLYDVPAHAGATTWQGGTADAFNETLTFQCDRLRGVIDRINDDLATIPDQLAHLRQQLAQLRAAREAALAGAMVE